MSRAVRELEVKELEIRAMGSVDPVDVGPASHGRTCGGKRHKDFQVRRVPLGKSRF